jgi:hypothetical protein
MRPQSVAEMSRRRPVAMREESWQGAARTGCVLSCKGMALHDCNSTLSRGRIRTPNELHTPFSIFKTPNQCRLIGLTVIHSFSQGTVRGMKELTAFGAFA